MPATIFSGQKIKTLKDTLTLNGKSDIISSPDDPTVSAVDAPIGSLLINQTSGKLYRKLDAGSSVNWEEVGAGVGGINYILNPSAEVNTTGWATYADAAGTAPVDGTGGSPNVTWTRSTTSPLRGVADFNFAKDAANRQGQGVSYDFTIDEADKAKVLSVTFDYEVLSGTYADGDLTVYLIADPTGTPVVIQPAGYTVQAATVGTTMREIATFQTQATGTSYRLCFHVASTSASAYTLAIDNVVVGPQQTVQGAAVSDWQAKSPNGGGWTTNTTYSITSRRVGDSAEFSYKIALSGAPNAATLVVNLPAGMTMDASKIADASNSGYIPIGYGLAYRSSVAYKFFVYYQNSTQVTVAYQSALTGASTAVNATSPVAWASGDIIDLWFTAPILGWSSNTVLSQDTDTRVVAAKYTTTAANPVSSGSTINIDFNTTSYDTHAARTGGGGSATNFVVPVSGYYKVTCALLFSNTVFTYAASRYLYLRIQPEGTIVCLTPITSTFTSLLSIQGSATGYFKAGDSIYINLVNASGSVLSLSGSATENYVTFERLSGPATVASSETVAMRANKTTGAHTSSGGWEDVASWTSVADDSHSFFNATTGVATIPVSGRYLCSASIGLDSVPSGTVSVKFLKNGSDTGLGSAYQSSGTTVSSHTIEIKCIAGDQIKTQLYQNSGGSRNYATTDSGSSISIVRVGN